MARQRRNPSTGATVLISLVSAATAVALTGIVVSMRSQRAINACMQIGSLLQGARPGIRPGGVS